MNRIKTRLINIGMDYELNEGDSIIAFNNDDDLVFQISRLYDSFGCHFYSLNVTNRKGEFVMYKEFRENRFLIDCILEQL